MSLIARLKGSGPSGFGYASTADEVTHGLDLSGSNILLTGSNSGIGLATLRTLARRGATVVATARTQDKARSACAGLPVDPRPLSCELSEPASVRACVAAVKQGPPLDAIICNAGIMALPRLQQAYGYELQFFTNHIGHFMLVTGLLDHLAPGARIVIVSSEAHRGAPAAGIELDNLSGEKGYRPWAAYGQSKLANLLFAKELSRRLAGRASANAVHPGVIKTNLGRSMPAVARAALTVAEPLLLKSAEQGAATQCYVATHPRVADVSGEYFADCNIARPKALANDRALAERLWQESEKIVASLPA